MAYLIFHNEEQLGPYEAEEIQSFVESGELPETVFIWEEGMEGWSPANSIFAFPKNELTAVASAPIILPDASVATVIDVEQVEVLDAGGKIERAFDDVLRKLVADEQDPAAVKKIMAKVSGLLTVGEAVEYVCVQKKPVLTIAPDAIVLTTRRFIVARPRLTGFQFQDFQWRQVHDVHLSEQMLGATISCEIVGGKKVAVDALPKKQARKVYAYAQGIEEKMIEERRSRDLEERRASAGGVTVQTAFAPTAHGSAPIQDDPMSQLAKLKQMLDAGLIEKGEFDAKKGEILGRM